MTPDLIGNALDLGQFAFLVGIFYRLGHLGAKHDALSHRVTQLEA